MTSGDLSLSPFISFRCDSPANQLLPFAPSMSTGLPSDEVADDYKNSLEDLVTNDRYQIGNLTVIAKENIEHGEAIARVLENHIQRVGTSFPRRSDCFPPQTRASVSHLAKMMHSPQFLPCSTLSFSSLWVSSDLA